jgi:electron transport complex protein RnfB
VHRILAALPQTQCTRCGYPDCAAYAQAIAREGAAINQCPPGGAQGIARLAAITGRPAAPLNPAHGEESARAVVFIDEQWCIGCTLCIKACPVDAIVGSNKRMHTVIEAVCTGCDLCIPVCPVDCIEREVVTAEARGWDAWSEDLAAQARTRYEARCARLEEASRHAVPELADAEPANAAAQSPEPPRSPAERRREAIAQAQARARALRRR